MRVVLFTGKGGVDKTSMAAATALRSAELGYRATGLGNILRIKRWEILDLHQ